jgi:glycolate oxidase FAD binding subunit
VSAPASVDDICAVVRAADAVDAVGARTHWEVGGRPEPGGVPVAAPAGIVAYDPRDLTVTVAAGTPVRELADALAEHGQECPLDPRSEAATVGGVVAVGLSGHRRLRYGPVRDRVLEVRFVTGDGRVVKGGGPTVKNVSGFDLPRLLVGSLGTIGIVVQVILRCQPRAPAAEWFTSELDPFEVRRRTFRPSCIAWDGHTTHVRVGGVARDIASERAAARATASSGGPRWPEGPHRGRVSVRPGAVAALGAALDTCGVRWIAEVGVGTVHVAADREAALARARAGLRGSRQGDRDRSGPAPVHRGRAAPAA